MDYERKYKDALGWMQSLYDGLHGATKEDAEHYFPELKEPEDERIRKGIIKYLDWIKDRDGSYMPNNIPFDDMISWLKKQGGQKPADMVVHKDYSSIDQHFFKSAWSEGDGKMLDSIIYNFGLGIHSTIDQDKWLKSLKERMKGE